MDHISDANGILWLFAVILAFYLLTVILSVLIWINNEKLSRIFYLADAAVTAVICFVNMQIVFASTAYGASFVMFLPWGRVFAVLGTAMTVGSVILRKKDHRMLCNILLNISTAAGLILVTYLVQIRY